MNNQERLKILEEGHEKLIALVAALDFIYGHTELGTACHEHQDAKQYLIDIENKK